jgi:hypothetical protein
LEVDEVDMDWVWEEDSVDDEPILYGSKDWILAPP